MTKAMMKIPKIWEQQHNPLKKNKKIDTTDTTKQRFQPK